MGAWGVGLFENDAAGDAREAFRALVPSGRSVEACVERVLDGDRAGRPGLPDGAKWLASGAEADLVLALASLVLEYRVRQPGLGPLARAVLERAREITASGEGLAEWPAQKRAARRAVYEALERGLAAAMPRAEL